MRDQTRYANYPVGNSTLYENGCSLAVHQHTAWVGSWVLYGIVLLAVLTIMLLVICRYLQTSISEALRAGDLSLPSRGYLLSFGQQKTPGTRPPPPSPATQPSSPEPATRDRKVAKSKSKQKRRDVNKSNRQANNSAALSELLDELLSDSFSQWSVNTDLELIVDQLAPSSLSERTQTTSGPASDSGTTADIPDPTAMLPGTASQHIPVFHLSDSSNIPSVNSNSSPSSSPITRLHDNWNANANTRSLRPAQSAVTADAEFDRSRDDSRQVSSRHTRSTSSARWQTRKYSEQSKTRLRSTSKSVTTQPLSRVRSTEHSYQVAEKFAEGRKREKSNGTDVFINLTSVVGSSPLQRVTQSEQMKTHKVEDDRHTEKAHSEDLKSVSERGSASCPLNYLPKASTSMIWQQSSPPAEPRGEGICPLTETPGSLKAYSTDGRSSEWSTVSCETQTVGDATLSESKRVISSTRRDISDINRAALLSISKYVETYKGNLPTSTKRYESSRGRSQKSSKVVQKSSAAAVYPEKMYQTKELTGASKNGRLSSNSWSTISCQTMSRPPSSTFHDEIIVEQKRSRRSTSEHVHQTNNRRNSSLGSRFDEPEMRRLLSNILQQAGVDSSRAHRSKSKVEQVRQTNNSNANTHSLRSTQSVLTAEAELDRSKDNENISRRHNKSKSSAKWQTPKYPNQSKTQRKSRSKDNSCNSELKRHIVEPEMRELLSKILQQADIDVDQSSSSVTSFRSVGQASRESHLTPVTQSEQQSLQPNGNIKSSITSVLSSPMVYAAIRAIQLRPDEAGSVTSSVQSPFDGTVCPHNSVLQASSDADPLSAKTCRSADCRGRMEQIQQIQRIVDNLKISQQSIPFQCSLGQSGWQFHGT